MEIVHYKSIKEIPQNEWEKYGLDFALSDGGKFCFQHFTT